MDVTLSCRYFHVCWSNDDQQNAKTTAKTTAFINTFICPEDLVFNQATLTCTTHKDLTVPCHAQEMLFAEKQFNNQLLPEPLPEPLAESIENETTTNPSRDIF